jgi:hypothetical protein
MHGRGDAIAGVEKMARHGCAHDAKAKKADALRLKAEPVADCSRYDTLRPKKEERPWSAIN